MRFVKVSVIMAAYNVERYIDEAIQSVLVQRGVSFELLIGDDVSTDGTWSRIENYQADPRVRAWCFRRRRGAAAVRNFLLHRARGRYLSICDSDDVMLSENLKRLSRVLDKNPEVGVTYGDLVCLGEDGRLFSRKNLSRVPEWDLLRNPSPHSGSLMRRVLVMGIGGYRAGFEPAEDYDLFLRLGEFTKFRLLKGRPLYLWRRHPQSLTRLTSWRRQRFFSKKAMSEAILRRYRMDVSR